MIGQKYLVGTIDKLIQENSLPRTILFEGEYGCGKHTITKEISKQLGYELVDLTDSIKLEVLQEIQLNPYPKVYLINCDEITVKEQNMILKFLEEPLKNSYIILITTSKQKLLQTVVNRCQCYTFEAYGREELDEFIEPESSDYIRTFGTTPGWIKILSNCNIDEIVSLCEKIFLKINVANYSNVLTIPEKICFTKEPDGKIDFNIFSYILINISKSLYENKQIDFKIYEMTSKFFDDTHILNINKRHLFENYLVRLKFMLEGGVL